MMSQTKKLSIAFYWHMHQPVYQLSPDGDYLMAWGRLHAVKDYLDMITILDDFKNIKVNVNLVPVLLDSLIDYGENGCHDLHSRLTITPVEELNNDDKEFILNNFFDANYKTMIYPYPQYNKLFQKRQGMVEVDVSQFSDQEYSDLMALFNLVWFDPSYKYEYPELRKLLKKGKNYTLKDRQKIIELQREIIRKIIPAYRKYVEEGKVEVTTSPYYHPILPILLDIKSIKIANPEGLPSDLKMGIDDIRVDSAYFLGSTFYVTGKNFNEWSTICIDDKRLETVYINQNVLMAECDEPEHSSYIDVAQIGKDGVILSESEGYVYHPKNPDEYS